MGRNISLFSGYDHKENRTTNYCLLILKLLYDEGPRLFAEFLSAIGGGDLGNLVGVKFTQQERTGKSVPDGVIRQRSFTAYVETKNYNWFYDQQLEAHLDGLYREPSDCKILVALGNFEEHVVQDQFAAIDALCRAQKILFKALSFEQFYDSLPTEGTTKSLQNLIQDFRTYLDQQGLLPSWRAKLDVVNCSGLPEDILDRGVYMCPAEGGAYSHQRCEYFGMYAGNKRVERVALIRAVVDVSDQAAGLLLWRNVPEVPTVLVAEAVQKVLDFRNEYPTRVFLLGDLHPTIFSKESRGGLQGNKIYFDVSSFDPKDASEVAAALYGKEWKDVPRW